MRFIKDEPIEVELARGNNAWFAVMTDYGVAIALCWNEDHARKLAKEGGYTVIRVRLESD